MPCLAGQTRTQEIDCKRILALGMTIELTSYLYAVIQLYRNIIKIYYKEK